jgi:hypothetical protein
MINEQIMNMSIVVCVLLCMNIFVSIVSVLLISSKIRELKNIAGNNSKTNTTDTLKKEDVPSKKDKDNSEYNGIGGKIKKIIELAEDDDMFDDDYLFDEQRLAKDRTDEIIDLIDLYEMRYNLNKNLVADVKAGKFELLTEKKLLRLNEKYNKINPISANNQRQKAKRVVVKKRFADGQDLVNYVAEDSNRLIYDTKLKTNSKVHAFDIDDNGNLLIYYSKYGAPSIFKPNRYGIAG